MWGCNQSKIAGNQEGRPHLGAHEWAVVVPLVAALVAGACIASGGDAIDDMVEVLGDESVPRTVAIKVVGAVAKPGIYHVEAGTSIGQLLEQVEPTAEANLRRLNQEAPLTRSRTLKIKAQEMIAIVVDGAAVTTGIVQVPKGTRLADWAAQADLDADADRTALTSRRYLKNGERIVVPRKKSFL